MFQYTSSRSPRAHQENLIWSRYKQQNEIIGITLVDRTKYFYTKERNWGIYKYNEKIASVQWLE